VRDVAFRVAANLGLSRSVTGDYGDVDFFDNGDLRGCIDGGEEEENECKDHHGEVRVEVNTYGGAN
jgi:hypothetical protein